MAAPEWRTSIAHRVVWAILLVFPGLVGVVILGALFGSAGALGGLVAFVAFIGAMWWVQSGVRLTVTADAVERRGRFGARVIRWRELESYRCSLYFAPTAADVGANAFGAIGALVLAAYRSAKGKPLTARPRWVRLRARDGRRITAGAELARGDALLSLLTTTATEHLLPAAVAAFDSGAVVWFGKGLSVRRGEGVLASGTLGRRVLPFADIEYAGFDGLTFVVRKEGKTLAWARLPIGRVLSPHVAERVISHARARVESPAAGDVVVPVKIER